MVRSALVLCLLSSVALGQTRMYQPPAPELVGYPNWVLLDDGKQRLDATLERQARELEQLRAENASLQTTLTEWQGKPALTWKGALLLVGGGLVLGLAIAVPVVLAVRR